MGHKPWQRAVAVQSRDTACCRAEPRGWFRCANNPPLIVRVVFAGNAFRTTGAYSWQTPPWERGPNDQQPCRLDYLVVCDSGWQTLSGTVTGWVGNRLVEVALLVDSTHHWRLNGTERFEVKNCIDLDLNFSPSTNLLPIRRLNLAVGQEEKVNAAWLRFPSFTLEPLEQIYRRLDVATYRYESAGGRFIAELEVNAAGFVILYPNIWEAEAYS